MMTAFSPTLADAFWILMATGYPGSTATLDVATSAIPISAIRPTARLDTSRATPSNPAPCTCTPCFSPDLGRRGRGPTRTDMCRRASGRPRPRGPPRGLLRDREDPDHAALRHVLLPAEEIGKQPLLERWVDAPAGHDADVLHTVDREGSGRRDDAGVRADLPQQVSGRGVEGSEVPVIRPAREDQPAARGQDPPPVHRGGVLVAPHLLRRADVPGLDLAEVLRALVDREADIGDVDAGPPLPGHVLLHLAFHEPAVIVVGGNVEARRLGVVGCGHPVLAAPERRTEVGALARARLALGIVLGTAGRRIDALEHVLLDVPGRGDEPDPLLAPLQ